MSGHNKWAQIKHKKAIEDAKRSKVFSMHSRTITMEAKKAAGDKNSPGLKAAVDRAKSANMPNDNIERAVQKGIGTGASSYETVIYECYGPGGIAIIIEGLTDNTNRTTQEIKHLLSKHDTALGGQGSAAWAFTKGHDGWVAIMKVDLNKNDADKMGALLLELEVSEDVKNIFTTMNEDEGGSSSK